MFFSYNDVFKNNINQYILLFDVFYILYNKKAYFYIFKVALIN